MKTAPPESRGVRGAQSLTSELRDKQTQALVDPKICLSHDDLNLDFSDLDKLSGAQIFTTCYI